MLDPGSGSYFIQINTIIGCLIFLFIIYQGWKLTKYIYDRYVLKKTVKFPTLSSIIFFSCITFYCIDIVATINTSQPVASPTKRPPTSAPRPTKPAAPPPHATHTPKACLHWKQVTSAMYGSTVCVYGEVAYDVTNYQFFIYFGTEKDLFLTSTEFVWEDIKGKCVQAQGKVQLNTYKVPYILIDDLRLCN